MGFDYDNQVVIEQEGFKKNSLTLKNIKKSMIFSHSQQLLCHTVSIYIISQ